MAFRLQEAIHNFEEGAGKQLVTTFVAIVAMVAMVAIFDTVLFRNMTTPEGMEAAQLARNLADGKGYTSLILRPFAMELIQKRRHEMGNLVKENLPDIQNPPLYPVLLAGWLKLMPFSYKLQTGKTFTQYRPDFWIALFNQLLLLIAVWLVYRLAVRLFDPTAGWMSAAAFAGTWLYWQLAFTGHGTLLLVVLFLLLSEALFRADEAGSGETPSPGRVLAWAAIAGLCVGLGALTRYSFVWLIFPVMAFLLFFVKPSHVIPAVVALVSFLVVFSPWVVRNIHVSGAPFGLAGYAICQGTEAFPEDELERSIHPKFETYDYLQEARRKVVNNLRDITATELQRIGGNWLGVISVVGLLIPFRRPALNRLRWFGILAVVFLLLAQAGGRTYLTKENPDISSENLLVIVAPLLFIFGVGLILSLVGQLRLTPPLLQYLLLVSIVITCSLPMILSFLPPLPYVSSVVYPPYFPPFFQRIGRLSESGTASTWEKELIMTDVPAGISWYSRCPSAPLTLNYRNDPADKVKDDFYELSDYRRSVKALYLTQRTLKNVQVRGMADAGKDLRARWENFVGFVLIKGKLPPEFPLQRWAETIWPEQFYAEFPSNK